MTEATPNPMRKLVSTVYIARLEPVERDAILAGLRLLQRALQNGDLAHDDLLRGILTNAGKHDGLTIESIDALCHRLNNGDF